MWSVCCLQGPLVALGLKSADEPPIFYTFPKGFEETRARRVSEEQARREQRRSRLSSGDLELNLRFCDDPVKFIPNVEKFDPEHPYRVAAPKDDSFTGNSCIEEDFKSRRAYHQQVDEDEERLFPLLLGYRAAFRFDLNVMGTRVRWHNRYECQDHPNQFLPPEERDEAFEDGKLFSLSPGSCGYCEQGYGRPCEGSEADMTLWEYNFSVDAADRAQAQLKVFPNPPGKPKSAYTRRSDAPYCDPDAFYWRTVTEGKTTPAEQKETRLVRKETTGCMCMGPGLVMFLSSALAPDSKSLDTASEYYIQEASDYGSMF